MAARVTVVTVGRPAAGPWRALAEDYGARIASFVPFSRRVVRPSRARGAPARRREETRALIDAVPARARIVALDAGGRPFDTPAFGRAVASWIAGDGLAFLVGGPDGIDGDSLAEAAGARPVDRLALGPMTLSHDLALIVLLEQVYRALAGARNHPYARH